MSEALEQNSDSWYEEISEIVDTVAASVDQYPEIQGTLPFLNYSTIFSRVLKRVLFECLVENDVVDLKAAAVLVLPNQLKN